MEDRLLKDGWQHEEHEGLIRHLGGLWHRMTPEGPQTGFIAREFHINRNGVVHGGMLMTAVDRAFGFAARTAAKAPRAATISLTHQFLAPLKLGSFAWIHPRVSRVTGRMAFLDGDLIAEGEVVMQAQGVWRLIREGS